ncbi:ferrochelatase [Gallibacterium sp. ZY190522]
MQADKRKTGVLLVNLGTPDAPTIPAVKRYLRQFLTDPRIIDLPRWQWLPLLNLIILPKRAPRVAKLYQQIWQTEGSPLLAISRRQQSALQQRFQNENENVVVELAMTYGNPSMEDALQRLYQKQVNDIILLPLYPQYSSTTTASVLDTFHQALRKQRHILPFEIIFSYHNHPNYITALSQSIQPYLQNDVHLLFSFHGIPQRYQQLGDYYDEHCRQTVNKVVTNLDLNSNQWTMSYQSRFGKEPWLQPYTDETLTKLAQQGVEEIVVICPGFAVDCLETLEEIAVENRDIFLAAGGKQYQYIPALNDSEQHIELLYQLIKEKLR